jgi:hypothetical protein
MGEGSFIQIEVTTENYFSELKVFKRLPVSGYLPHRSLWMPSIVGGTDGLYSAFAVWCCQVVPGNPLNERGRVLLTPGHYLGNWSCRLRGESSQAA